MSSTCCIICSDLFNATDEVFVTKCGHIFHHTCLLHWIEQSKSCPQCRQKTTEKLISRIYLNFVSNEGVSLDAGSLQVKLDNAELQLKEKKKAEIRAQEKLEEVQNQYLKSQEKLISIKQKLTEKDSAVAAMKEQINYLKVEHDTVEQLRSEKEVLQQSLNLLKNVEEVLYGSASDVERLIKESNDQEHLCSYISILKKVVIEAENKKKQLGENLRTVKCQLSKFRTENKVLMTKNVALEESLSHSEEEIKSLKSQIDCARLSSDVSQSSQDSCSSSTTLKRKPDTVEYEHIKPKLIKYSSGSSSGSTSHDSSIVASIKDSSSPYLSLKQSSSALANLQLKKSATTSCSTPKTNEYSIFKSHRPSTQAVTKNNGDLFKAMLQKRKERETDYDGLGGHSRTDTFPIPLSKNAIKLANATSIVKKKQTMKDKMKRLQRPANQSTIKKAFHSDGSEDL